jgi:predicted O-methyltransferase YrrM
LSGKSVADLKAELERFGKENDAAKTVRAERMLNITRDTGEFLSVLARATAARRILEIGTSNGYSTLWLAEAAKATGGKVATVESSQFKIDLAAANFARSGLASLIDLVHDDAGRFLERAGQGVFDLIFLDSERSEYLRWWPLLDAALRSGGLLVVDNATSHAAEIAPFTALVGANGSYTSCLVPVGNGEYLAVKAR